MAKMSKAQYLLITDALAKSLTKARVHWESGDKTYWSNHCSGIRDAAAAIGEALLADNPAFDYKLFMDRVRGVNHGIQG